MATDFDKRDRLRQERERRDAMASAEHEAAVAAAPDEERVLVRAVNGELVSYTLAEYGVGKSGHGPTIRTWQGYAVGVLFLVGLLVTLTVMVVGDLADAPPDPPWWFLPLLFGMALPFITLFARNLRKEYRANQLRAARGLPRPGS